MKLREKGARSEARKQASARGVKKIEKEKDRWKEQRKNERTKERKKKRKQALSMYNCRHPSSLSNIEISKKLKVLHKSKLKMVNSVKRRP